MAQRHIVTALVSIFSTGIVLVLIAAIFGIELAQDSAASTMIDKIFLETWINDLVWMGIITIFVGLALTILRIWSMDKVEPKSFAAAPVVQTAAPVVVAPATSAAPAAVGGGLKILRPEGGKVESKPAEPAAAPSAAPKPAATPKPAAAPAAAPSAAPAKKAEAPVNMTFDEALQNIVDRYNTEKVKKSFKGWVNNLNMTFPDLNRSVIFAVNGDEGITMSDGVDESAAVKVKLGSDIFIKMLTKQINPIKAYSSGNLEVKGEMKNMLKLRQLMF